MCTQPDREALHKEIDLIQACISRMAHNSFLIKGWAISIVAVVLALGEKTDHTLSLSIALLIPLLSFWYLDAFFLYTEKLYRKMYEWVIEKRPQGNEEKRYDLNPHRFKKVLKVQKLNQETGEKEDTDKEQSEWTNMRTKTLACFYGIPVLLVLIVIAIQLAPKVCDLTKCVSPPKEKEAQATVEHVIPSLISAPQEPTDSKKQ